jgi:hypothetical protein
MINVDVYCYYSKLKLKSYHRNRPWRYNVVRQSAHRWW